jgi:prepilin-type N-terminal cleavage/methylation domain-containing protein
VNVGEGGIRKMRILKRLSKTGDGKGFTLIELLIILAIIGILATIAIPTFAGYRSKGYDSAAVSDLRAAATTQEVFHTDNDIYTNNLAALQAAPYNLSLSSNVTVNIIAADNTSYTMTALHASSGKIYTLTGPGGSITP